MICYRDRTYCNAPCEAECSRRLTDEVREAARRWWGSDDAPIAVSDLSATCALAAPASSKESDR